jgi:nucleoid DNA-binding protein
MRTLKSGEIIRSISKEENITKQQVEDVIQIHFEFVRYVQSQLLDRNNNYFPTVRLPNFGSFYVSENMKKRLIEHNNKKKQENESN